MRAYRQLSLFNQLLTSHWPVIVAIIVIGTLTTLLAWSTSRDRAAESQAVALESQAAILQDTLERRLSVYSEILRGAAALFTARQNEVTSDEWRGYVSSLKVRERYPGSLAVGYVQFIDEAKSISRVTYIEPLEESNKNVIGVNMYANPARRAAMERARDSGAPQLSQSLVLMRGTINDERGVLYYAPVYQAGMAVGTVDERRAAIRGFVYMPVRTSVLFAGIVGRELSSRTKMTVDELDAKEGVVRIFATKNRPGMSWPVQTQITIGGIMWQAALSFDEHENWWDDARSIGILVGGLIMTFALAGFVWVVIRARARELEFQRQMDVQAAKDELVSLASHQLRTPATGVKQYLGMVLEGYAGKITRKQREMLQRAFESNERQIETVGQILHITRLESERLEANMGPISLRGLVDTIVNEHKSAINDRHHKVRVKHRGDSLFQGDHQYIRMAIENLLDNAIKYTPPKGKITIETETDEDSVRLRVTDTGVGIAVDDYEKMYEKFSRLDNPLSVEAGGSGVGLYLLKMIVDDMHHGEVSVESDIGVGTTFVVTLPRKQAGNGQA